MVQVEQGVLAELRDEVSSATARETRAKSRVGVNFILEVMVGRRGRQREWVVKVLSEGVSADGNTEEVHRLQTAATNVLLYELTQATEASVV